MLDSTSFCGCRRKLVLIGTNSSLHGHLLVSREANHLGPICKGSPRLVGNFHRARAAASGSISCTAFITGPHGISEPVNQYESVLLIASGSGTAAVIPYLKKLIYGYDTSTCRTRRVHLAWQLRTLGEFVYSVERNILTQVSMAIAAEASELAEG
jgi:hypothetical protein